MRGVSIFSSCPVPKEEKVDYQEKWQLFVDFQSSTFRERTGDSLSRTSRQRIRTKICAWPSVFCMGNSARRACGSTLSSRNSGSPWPDGSSWPVILKPNCGNVCESVSHVTISLPRLAKCILADFSLIASYFGLVSFRLILCCDGLSALGLVSFPPAVMK